MSEPRLYIKAKTNYNANPPASYKRDADYWEKDVSNNLFYMSGNVGIGYPIPNSKFVISGNLGIGTSKALSILDVSGNGYFRGNVGIGTSNPIVQLDISGNLSLTGNLTTTGRIPQSGDALLFNSVYQWDGATYRNPGDYSTNVIRKDNTTTDINGFFPTLLLYNKNGADNTTVGIEFACLEATAPSNSSAIAGIIAKKDGGIANSWSQGSLNFFTKNLGTRVDAVTIKPNGDMLSKGVYAQLNRWNGQSFDANAWTSISWEVPSGNLIPGPANGISASGTAITFLYPGVYYIVLGFRFGNPTDVWTGCRLQSGGTNYGYSYGTGNVTSDAGPCTFNFMASISNTALIYTLDIWRNSQAGMTVATVGSGASPQFPALVATLFRVG